MRLRRMVGEIAINKYLIAPTSQFYYCGLPFRIDSTSKCTYNCQYCFAKLRGGFRSQDTCFLDSQKLSSRFCSNKISGIINELISSKMPIHFGGMSDPNCNQYVSDITFSSLNTFASNNYPVVVSTKNPEPYLYVDRDYSSTTIIQVSFSTIDGRLANVIEPYAPSPENRIKSIEALVKLGYKVTARIQPFLYSLKEEVLGVLIPTLIDVGVDHVIFEHLKLPVESNSRNTLSSLCQKSGISLELYEKHGILYGRSILLPNEIKIDNILEAKRICEKSGVTFGAGDYGFYHFSSTDCCCGIDKYFPDSNWFKGNFTNVIKHSKGKELFISELQKYEYPKSNISMYINSHSRIENNSIKHLLVNKWNKPGTANAIDSYYGIRVDSYLDDKGNYVYLKGI